MISVLKLSEQSDTPVKDMQRCKKRLERIIEHWDNPELGGFNPYSGLCSNVFYGYVDNVQRKIMFSTWEHFNGDIHYPVEGEYQYRRTDNMYTPERKSLAEHCLKLITELLEEIENV